MHALSFPDGSHYKLYGNDYIKILEREMTDRIESEVVCLHAGDVTPEHAHSDLEQVFIITLGTLRLDIAGETKQICAPGMAYVPRNAAHRVTALTDAQYVFVSCWHETVAPARTEEQLRAYERKLVEGDPQVSLAQKRRAKLR